LIQLALVLAALPLWQPQTFTAAQLRAMDHPALARHLLGSAGERMTEHRVVVGDGGLGAPIGLHRVDFARPATTMERELCLAERIRVGFRPVFPVRSDDSPAIITEVATGRLWALRPTAGCAALGNALADPADPGPFFTASGSYADELNPTLVRRAVVLLRGFLDGRGAAVPLACRIAQSDEPDPRESACADRAATLALLDVARLAHLQLHPCRGGERLCADFHFADPGNTLSRTTALVLSLETDARGDAHLEDAHRVIHARLGKVTRVG
jgi:hypothetical protein